MLVVGDFFLDRYFVTDPSLSERSIETGLEARQVVQTRSSAGAAGNVAVNLRALGCEVEAVGAVGADGEGFELRRVLASHGVRLAGITESIGLSTPTYVKPMIRTRDGEREIERLDIRNHSPLPAAVERRIIGAVHEAFRGAPGGSGRPGAAPDAVLIVDQVAGRNEGCITNRVRDEMSVLAAANPRTIFLADSRSRIGEYRAITLKPNLDELRSAAGESGEWDMARIEGAGKALADRAGRAVFVTLGEAGMLVCSAGQASYVPAYPAAGPIDAVGAGDSAAAGICCALCAGASPPQAAAFGNLCASVTVRKLGVTGSASPEELRSALARASE